MEKRCPKCAQNLPLEDFNLKSRDGGERNAYCKPCQRTYCKMHYLQNKELHNQRRYIRQKRYRLANKARMKTFLESKACVDCGEADPVVLEFDHVRGEKKGAISEMVLRAFVWRRIEAELGKCEVRCANCHRRKTARERGWNSEVAGV